MLLLLYNLDFRAVADTHRVCIVRIHVHFQTEILVHTHLYVVPTSATLSFHVHRHVFAVLHAKRRAIRRRHVNMSICDNATFFELNDALRPNDRHGRRAFHLARFSYGGLHFQYVRIRCGDFHLRFAAQRT